MGSRSTAYRWHENDGCTHFAVILPSGDQVFGSARSDAAANTVIGAVARAFGSPLTIVRATHPNRGEVAHA